MTFLSAVAPTCAVAALVINTAPSMASAVYYPATDEVKFVNDGESGVYAEYGVGKIFLLWNDNSVANLLSAGTNNSGTASTWSLWDEDWGPKTGPVIAKIRKWRELPAPQQRKFINTSEASRWSKVMFATANSPRRYPAQSPANTATQNPIGSDYGLQSIYEPSSDGCPAGKSRYRTNGLFGLGRRDLGCMTDYEANSYRQQQIQNSINNMNTNRPRNCTTNIIGSQAFTNCY